jgi:hypothetical protein
MGDLEILDPGPELPDGVYINLKEEPYFAQRRIGSTGGKVLCKHPADFWYGEPWLNPDFENKEATAEMDFGKALHVATLEGDEAYAAAVAVHADTYLHPKGDERPWHWSAGPCVAWGELNKGKIILSQSANRRVRHMAALIMNHPELGSALKSGMSEVSVLFTLDGVKFRSRFDKLLPKFTCDLKSYFGNARGRDLVQQCLNLVDDRDMDVQRYLYDVAREHLCEFVRSGKVYGADDVQREWLSNVARIEEWRWCWIFYRRRDDKLGHAPVIQPIFRSHGDVTWKSGKTKVEAAIQNYKAFMARFGERTPWARIEPGIEPDDSEFSPWMSNIPTPESLSTENEND